MKNLAFLLPLAALATACSHKGAATAAADAAPAAEFARPAVVRGAKPAVIPKASAFKMSGDYAQNVAVTLDSQGGLTYFPAPSDISGNSAPLDLGGGWWLNRQGIGPNSVFTSFTFDDYRALPNAPSPAEIKAAIIPGAKVVEMVQLPFSINDADSHISEIKNFLKAGSIN